MRIYLQTASKLLFILPLLLLWHSNGFAQHTVTGTVIDAEDQEPLAGVNIIIRGTTQGTSTNQDGAYEINVPSESDTLMVSFVGYETRTIPINGRSEIDIELTSQQVVGEELVVVGYGTQRREEVTSAVSSVSSEEFIQASPKDAASLIKGKIAGLNISEPSGNPVSGTEIKLRGTTTLNASSEPLILIDGVPGDLNTVAPENIESIDVLKDGSAAAIYGSRGSNGVILITTKRHGANQPTTLRYQGYVDVQQITKMPGFLDAEGVRSMNEQFGPDGSGEFSGFTDYGFNTDWPDRIMRTPVSQNHTLTLSGGNASTSYSTSLNYRPTNGLFIRSENELINGRINVNHSMFEGKLVADVSANSRIQTYWTGGDGFSFNNSVWRHALIRNPTDRVFNTDNDAVKWQERPIFNYVNPVGLLKESGGENENRELRLNGTLTYNPVEELSLSILGSTSRWNQERGYSESFQHFSTTANNLDGYASRGLSSNQDNLLELTATYENSFGIHSFNVLGGYSWQEVTTENFFANTFNFPTDLFDYNSLESGQAINEGEANIGSGKESFKLIGFFGRVNYNYDDRYILMGSVRYEGNSKFGADNKWGVFPAVSAGWRISNESFMETVDFINDLKIRAGYGVTGIAPGDPYQSLASFSYGGSFFNNGEWVQGIEPSRNANPNLKWERKEEINLGLDFTVLDDRIEGSLDLYKRTTKDLLFNYDVPSPPFLFGEILANVGEMENRGLEAVLNFQAIQKQDLSWTTGLTYSTNSNKLVTLSNDQFSTENNFINAGGIGESVQLPTHRIEVGGQVGNFFGYKTVDIDENGEWIIEDPEGNRVNYVDISLEDRQVLGNGVPNHNLSWNNTFRYKNFDLSTTVRGAFDFQILNLTRLFHENPRQSQYNLLESAFEPIYGKRLLNNEWQYMSYYIEDGDYVKVDNITLGYTFNVNNLNIISNARLYVSSRNVFTITGYSGIDPEVGIGGLNPGVEPRDQYPTTRTFTFGVDIQF